MPKLVYIIGEPGTGKSTLFKRAAQSMGLSIPSEPSKMGLVTYYELERLVALGSYSVDRGGYGGTDALPMNVMPAALKFLEFTSQRWPEKHLFAEGDRLATAKFFQEAELMGYELKVFCLKANQRTLDNRYDERKSNQSRSFLKSRRTKCNGLVKTVGATVLSSENREDLHRNLSLLLTELS